MIQKLQRLAMNSKAVSVILHLQNKDFNYKVHPEKSQTGRLTSMKNAKHGAKAPGFVILFEIFNQPGPCFSHCETGENNSPKELF